MPAVLNIRRPSPRDTDEVLEEIGRTGFAIVHDLIPKKVADQVRSRLNAVMREEISDRARGLGHQRVLHLAVKVPESITLLCDPFVLTTWRKYLGEDMICSSWTANTLLPGSDTTYWHVDHPYWTIKPPYPTWPMCCMCIWCLDDFTIENGAPAGIPGSHQRPYLPDMDKQWVEEAEVLTGPRGSVILADGAWWHTSRPNRTDQPRVAVIGKYIRSFCTPQEDLTVQLADIDQPSDELKRLFGAEKYKSQRGFPY